MIATSNCNTWKENPLSQYAGDGSDHAKCFLKTSSTDGETCDQTVSYDASNATVYPVYPGYNREDGYCMRQINGFRPSLVTLSTAPDEGSCIAECN